MDKQKAKARITKFLQDKFPTYPNILPKEVSLVLPELYRALVEDKIIEISIVSFVEFEAAALMGFEVAKEKAIQQAMGTTIKFKL